MKKIITVKKSKLQRMGLRFFTAIIVTVIGMMLAFSNEGQVYIASLCLPWILLLFVLLLYYETWQISFSSDAIYKNIFFLTTGKYSYDQIINVIMAHSYTEHAFVRISFSSNKYIMFRLEDENAKKAVKRIQSHHSIQVLL